MKFNKLEQLKEANECLNLSQSFRNSRLHQQLQQQNHLERGEIDEHQQQEIHAQLFASTLPPTQFTTQQILQYKNTENLEYEKGIQIPEDEEVEKILAGHFRNQRLVDNNNFKITSSSYTTAGASAAAAATTTTTNTMPSKQIGNDVLAVEELVHNIKENLRLKARPSHNHGRSSRPSPYHIPCRSWNDQNTNYSDRYQHHRIKSDDKNIDDPYELLQALIKSNNLVKEAVRRLQLNSISPKRRSCYYESDEESRSPMFRMYQLEM